MSVQMTPCVKCNGTMTIQTLETFNGEEEGVKVTIQGMPACVCGQGHKRFTYPAFASSLMDLVMDEDTYSFAPSAVKKGLFTKHFHCHDCGNELPGSPTGIKSRELTANIKHSEPFKVSVDVPVYKCDGCGKESIHSAEMTGQQAMKATGHAYRGIDIHP